MQEFSKKSEAEKFLNTVIEKKKNQKIKTIFTFGDMIGNPTEYCSSDSNLYFLFEGGECLVISYNFIDCLEMELRALTPDEQKEYEKLPIKDFFNYDNTNGGIELFGDKCDFQYGSIASVEIEQVTAAYYKWIDGDIETVTPSEETFNRVKFIMSNGNSISVCADDAYADGYTILWVEESAAMLNSQKEAVYDTSEENFLKHTQEPIKFIALDNDGVCYDENVWGSIYLIVAFENALFRLESRRVGDDEYYFGYRRILSFNDSLYPYRVISTEEEQIRFMGIENEENNIKMRFGMGKRQILLTVAEDEITIGLVHRDIDDSWLEYDNDVLINYIEK